MMVGASSFHKMSAWWKHISVITCENSGDGVMPMPLCTSNYQRN